MPKKKGVRKVKKIAGIGGGDGLKELLRGGIKVEDAEVVGMCGNADYGGVSKVAADEYDGPRCLGDLTLGISAIADPRWMPALTYRFPNGSLKGWAMRHVMLLGFLKANNGALDKAIEEMCAFCGTAPHRMMCIAPSPVHLQTDCTRIGLPDQRQLRSFGNEAELDMMSEDPNWSTYRVKKLSLSGEATIGEEQARVLGEADLVAVASGSLHGSIRAALLPKGVRETIGAAKGKLVFFLNLFRTHGDPSWHYQVKDFIVEAEMALGRHLDYIVCDDNSPASLETLARFGHEPIEWGDFLEEEEGFGDGSRVRRGSFVSVSREGSDGKGKERVVHSADAIANMFRRLFAEGEVEQPDMPEVTILPHPEDLEEQEWIGADA